MERVCNFQKWDRWFLGLAEYVATASKDPSTKVGCVVVGPDREIRSTGFNGFPRGVADDHRLNERDSKYPIIVHAEENSIAHAARIGVSLKECTAYITFPPCSRCARLLIQSGISECVWPDQKLPERWLEDMERSKSLLKEAGVRLRAVEIEI